MAILSIIYILLFIIVALILMAVMQIKMAGMNIKDFWDFIQANDLLDRLYNFSKKYEKLNQQQQLIFLMEAEKVFKAFEKVPNTLWEEEYNKYSIGDLVFVRKYKYQKGKEGKDHLFI